MPDPLDALKSLSELALSVPNLEPLIVYDSVATIAAKLAEALDGHHSHEMAAAAAKAITTAHAVRVADRNEIAFREFLSPGGEPLC